MTKIIAAFAAALLCAALVAAQKRPEICCKALTTECEACQCKSHGEDCGKCLADPKCAMMTSGGCLHADRFPTDTSKWTVKKGGDVKMMCAKRTQKAEDDAICNAKDLQSPWACAKCTATKTSSGKCSAFKGGGCGNGGGMRLALDTCPKPPTPGAKCVKGTPDYAQIIEHCGKPFTSMSCECAEEGTWMCMAADPAPCDAKDGCCNYFDGCNTCTRTDPAAKFACTKKLCSGGPAAKCNKKCPEPVVCCEAMTQECQTCKCKAHGEDCGKCLADRKCAMMTTGGCQHTDVFPTDTAKWTALEAKAVEATCAKRTQQAEDDAICNAKDLQASCAKCTATKTSSGKCSAFKGGGCGNGGGMRQVLDKCPMPTAGAKCVKGTPDYTNIIEHCGEPFTASECTCAEEGKWMCMAAMPAPCVKDGCCSYFDGCNTCTRTDPAAKFACTEMACEKKKPQKCNGKCVKPCPTMEDICSGKASCKNKDKTMDCPCPRCLAPADSKGKELKVQAMRMAEKELASGGCANATAVTATCKVLKEAVAKAKAELVAEDKVTTSAPGGNNTQPPQVKPTQPGATTLAATTADSGGSNVEVLKLAKQLAEEAYKTEGCATTPDTDKCKGLQAAVNRATSALEDAEDSAATAFASASALVAVAVGIAAGVVF